MSGPDLRDDKLSKKIEYLQLQRWERGPNEVKSSLRALGGSVS